MALGPVLPLFLRARRSPRSQPGAGLAAGLLVLAALGAVAGCAPQGDERTLVKVGSRRVTVGDFMWIARNPQVVGQYAELPDSARKRALLDDLINYEVLAEAAVKRGFDKDSAYTKLEENLLPDLLPDALYKKHVGETVDVSDREAQLFHAQQATEYHLGMIAVPDSTQVPSVLARLDRGEAFETVAMSSSMDPQTRGRGGDLGWVMLGQMPLELEPHVRALRKGQHSRAVNTRQASYVIKLIDTRRSENLPPYDQARDRVMEMLRQRKRQAAADAYLNTLRRRYALALEGPGWDVLNGKVLTVPDSLTHFLASDPERAGIPGADLDRTLATWKGEDYSVREMLADLAKTPLQERPPANRPELFRAYVESRAMNAILITEARREGLDDSEDVRRSIAQAKRAWLVQKYVGTLAAGQPTPAELDSFTAQMLGRMGASGGADGRGAPLYADLPPEFQSQIVQEWQNQQQQRLLKTEVERLKVEIKPEIDEKALGTIPWPVPADTTDKENA